MVSSLEHYTALAPLWLYSMWFHIEYGLCSLQRMTHRTDSLTSDVSTHSEGLPDDSVGWGTHIRHYQRLSAAIFSRHSSRDCLWVRKTEGSVSAQELSSSDLPHRYLGGELLLIFGLWRAAWVCLESKERGRLRDKDQDYSWTGGGNGGGDVILQRCTDVRHSSRFCRRKKDLCRNELWTIVSSVSAGGSCRSPSSLTAGLQQHTTY